MAQYSPRESVGHSSHGDQHLVVLARGISKILREDADRVDREGVFPSRGMQALKEAGLMGLLIPREHGGIGGSYATLSAIAQVLSAECLSTALIWAMHCQQVAVLIKHAPEPPRTATLRSVAKKGLLIASITTEKGKGGHLLTAFAPLVVTDGDVLLSREAPTATGGLHADAYLITMRAGETSSPANVVLVYAERNSLDVVRSHDWDALGMRGTESIGLSLKGRIPDGQLLNHPRDFRKIAVTTMIPVGHIAWASCWLGAAWGIFDRTVTALRDPSSRGLLDIKSELFAERLARVRLDIDSIDCFLAQTILEYEDLLQDAKEPFQAVSSRSFQLRINGLKILASERSFRVANELMELIGMRQGYLRSKDIPIERTFRDLRSASLMLSNYRLLIANGKLAMLDAFAAVD